MGFSADADAMPADGSRLIAVIPAETIEKFVAEAVRVGPKPRWKDYEFLADLPAMRRASYLADLKAWKWTLEGKSWAAIARHFLSGEPLESNVIDLSGFRSRNPNDMTPSDWTEDEAFEHLRVTFDRCARHYPEFMEHYVVTLADAVSRGEQAEIMRAGLRETFAQRTAPKGRAG
jgi:hypothetical protein